jgi:glycosyltransferase involved in cell wall biosynthesis
MTKVLMISRDRNIFDENSEARQRMIEYGKLVEKLHIIVLSRPFKFLKIGGEIKGFNLVTTQDSFETGLVGWLAAKIFGARLQLQIHTDFLSKYFWRESLLNKIRVLIAKFLIPRADCVRVVSERIKKSLSAISYQLSAVSVLPIWTDVEEIKNASIKINLREKYPQFDFIILMASRFTKEKNISLAIEAMEGIVKKHPKTGLIITGSGSEEKKLKAETRLTDGQGYKLKANVIFEPWTDDLASYYKTADLFLLTSNYEGYGRTLIEAAAADCKIISSDVGIASEILEKENIFTPGDKKSLEEKIIKAISGEIKPAKPVKIRTKKEYLEEYGNGWKNCAKK